MMWTAAEAVAALAVQAAPAPLVKPGAVQDRQRGEITKGEIKPHNSMGEHKCVCLSRPRRDLPYTE